MEEGIIWLKNRIKIFVCTLEIITSEILNMNYKIVQCPMWVSNETQRVLVNLIIHCINVEGLFVASFKYKLNTSMLLFFRW